MAVGPRLSEGGLYELLVVQSSRLILVQLLHDQFHFPVGQHPAEILEDRLEFCPVDGAAAVLVELAEDAPHGCLSAGRTNGRMDEDVGMGEKW